MTHTHEGLREKAETLIGNIQNHYEWGSSIDIDIDAIISLIEDCVPEEADKSFRLEGYSIVGQIRIGWNACRDAMLKKIRGEK